MNIADLHCIKITPQLLMSDNKNVWLMEICTDIKLHSLPVVTLITPQFQVKLPHLQ